MARQVAANYRRRVARDAQWLRDVLPVWLVIGVGVLVVGAYGLSVFLPLADLLERFGQGGYSIRAGR